MRVYQFLILLISLILISGCGTQSTPAGVTPTPSQTLGPTETPIPGSDSSSGGAIVDIPGLGVVSTLAEAAPTRTPGPTATPDALTRGISGVVRRSRLSGQTLLWLSYAEWINLGISLICVLAGYLVGTWLIRWLLPRLVSRTQTDLDDRLLRVSGTELRWLAVVLILRFAVDRLSFVHASVKTFVADVSFSLALVLLVVILLRLISLAAAEAEIRAKKAGRKKEANPLITLSAWTLRLIVIILAISVSLSHFGFNITGFAIFLGIVGLAISLAGRDVLADIISGAMILIDQPYRVGDRIDLPSMNSWGDVYEIGMRSTKILAIDNRMVIIPNSLIGKNEIINYSYPDPSLYDESKVMVAYDNDIEEVGQLLVDTIREVEGVMIDREIVALLLEFQENRVIFTLGWWIKSSEEKNYVRNRVNRAIAKALKQAGVVMPYTAGTLNVDLNTHAKKPFQNSDG